MTPQPKTSIDIISAALHGDKKSVLTAELEMVRDEIKQRLDISKKQHALLTEELVIVRQRIFALAPFDPEKPPTTLPTFAREELEQEREAAVLMKEEREEVKECWNDVQHLRDVERSLLSQLLFLDQRNARLQEFL